MRSGTSSSRAGSSRRHRVRKAAEERAAYRTGLIPKTERAIDYASPGLVGGACLVYDISLGIGGKSEDTAR